MATRTTARTGAIGAVIDVTLEDTFVATAVMLEELGFDAIWLSGGRLERLDQVLVVLAATDSARPGTSIIAPDRFDSDTVLELYRRAEASHPGWLVVGLGGAFTHRAAGADHVAVTLLDRVDERAGRASVPDALVGVPGTQR